MKVLFLTRFSIFDPQDKVFLLNRKHSLTEYKELLFHKNRLSCKFRVFEKLTLPSIVGQSSDNWEWHIFASSEMPTVWVEQLDSLTRDYEQIHVHYVKDLAHFRKETNRILAEQTCRFATIRLDDDDSLPLDHVDYITQHYEDAPDHTIITFIHGNRLQLISDDQVLVYRDRVRADRTISFVGIGFNIYKAGNHTKIRQRHNVVEDPKPSAHFTCCGSFCDTQRAF